MDSTETPNKLFTLEDFEAADTAQMTVMAFGEATNWKWTFAGPGHPKTIAYNDRESRIRLQLEKAQEQTRVNNRKWKADDVTVDERRAKNVDWIVSRLVGWSDMKVSADGPDFPFNEENARRVLADQRKIDIYTQATEFLVSDTSFIKRSETT